MTANEWLPKLVAVLDKHDLRRWMRMLKGDGSLDYLRCYCGEKIYEDSNEAMLGHLAAALAAEGQAYADHHYSPNSTEQRDCGNNACKRTWDGTLLHHIEHILPCTHIPDDEWLRRAAAPSLHKEGAGGHDCWFRDALITIFAVSSGETARPAEKEQG